LGFETTAKALEWNFRLGYSHDLALIQPAPKMISPRPMVFVSKANIGFNKLIRLLYPPESSPRELAELSIPEGWELCIDQAYFRRIMEWREMSLAAAKETVFDRASLWRNHGDMINLQDFSGATLELVDPGLAEEAAIIAFQSFQIPTSVGLRISSVMSRGKVGRTSSAAITLYMEPSSYRNRS
jgi:hypothetical protein